MAKSNCADGYGLIPKRNVSYNLACFDASRFVGSFNSVEHYFDASCRAKEASSFDNVTLIEFSSKYGLDMAQINTLKWMCSSSCPLLPRELISLKGKIFSWDATREWTVFQVIPYWTLDGLDVSVQLPAIFSIRYIYAEEVTSTISIQGWRPKRNGVLSIVVGANGRSFFLSQMWNEVKGPVSSWELVAYTAFPLWPYTSVDGLKFSGTNLFFCKNEWRRDKIAPGAEGIVVLINDEEVKVAYKPTSTMFYDSKLKIVSYDRYKFAVNYEGASGVVEYCPSTNEVVRRADGKNCGMHATLVTPRLDRIIDRFEVVGFPRLGGDVPDHAVLELREMLRLKKRRFLHFTSLVDHCLENYGFGSSHLLRLLSEMGFWVRRGKIYQVNCFGVLGPTVDIWAVLRTVKVINWGSQPSLYRSGDSLMTRFAVYDMRIESNVLHMTVPDRGVVWDATPPSLTSIITYCYTRVLGPRNLIDMWSIIARAPVQHSDDRAGGGNVRKISSQIMLDAAYLWGWAAVSNTGRERHHGYIQEDMSYGFPRVVMVDDGSKARDVPCVVALMQLDEWGRRQGRDFISYKLIYRTTVPIMTSQVVSECACFEIDVDNQVVYWYDRGKACAGHG